MKLILKISFLLLFSLLGIVVNAQTYTIVSGSGQCGTQSFPCSNSSNNNNYQSGTLKTYVSLSGAVATFTTVKCSSGSLITYSGGKSLRSDPCGHYTTSISATHTQGGSGNQITSVCDLDQIQNWSSGTKDFYILTATSGNTSHYVSNKITISKTAVSSTIINTPTNLSPSNTYTSVPSSINFSWNKNGSVGANYKIVIVKYPIGSTPTNSNPSIVLNLGNTSNYTWYGSSSVSLESGYSYAYKIRAFDPNNTSNDQDSPYEFFSISSASLSTPTLSASTGSGSGEIDLSWSSVSNASYDVYRNGSYYNTYYNTSTTISGLNAGTNYCFQVKACNGSNCSSLSNTACANAGQSTSSFNLQIASSNLSSPTTWQQGTNPNIQINVGNSGGQTFTGGLYLSWHHDNSSLTYINDLDALSNAYIPAINGQTSLHNNSNTIANASPGNYRIIAKYYSNGTYTTIQSWSVTITSSGSITINAPILSLPINNDVFTSVPNSVYISWNKNGNVGANYKITIEKYLTGSSSNSSSSNTSITLGDVDNYDWDGNNTVSLEAGYSYTYTVRAFDPNTTSNLQDSPSRVFSISGTPPPIQSSITNINFNANPWQRADEDFLVTSLFADITGSVTQYYLHLKLNKTNGGTEFHHFGPFNEGQVYSGIGHSFSEKGTVSYWLDLLPSSTTSSNNISQTTDIIEKKWETHEDIIYDNTLNSTEIIKIPIKYFENATHYQVTFTRDNSVAKRVNPFSSYNTNLPNKLRTLEFSNRYLVINNTDLKDVHPGEFDITISYKDNSGNIIVSQVETGRINFVKIGHVNSFSFGNGTSKTANKPVVVFIGGWLSSLDESVYGDNQKYNNGLSSVSDDFSIIPNFATDNYNVWYIGQANNNYVVQNAYSIGIALEKIQQITNSSNIHIICHSKGGLDSRAMLGNLGKSMNNSKLFVLESSVLYNNQQYKIKSITFLGTPQIGATEGYNACITHGKGACDLRPISPIIETLKNSATLPNGFLCYNITGYQYSYAGPFLERSRIGDFVVSFNESNKPNLKYRNGIELTYVQDYMRANHISLHKVSELIEGDDDNSSCVDFNTLQKIKDFIDNSLVNYTPCPVPSMSISIFASQIPNASFELKITDGFREVGRTDETGTLYMNIPRPFLIGDTLRVTATGFYPLTFEVTEEMVNSKFTIGMIPLPNTSEVKYPYVNILSNNVIETQNTVNIKVKGENLVSYDIWTNNDSANTFQNYLYTDSIITYTLSDTGHNFINVRLLGINGDTSVIQKEVIYFPNDIVSNYSFNTNLNVSNNNVGAEVYVNRKHIKTITQTTETLKLMNGNNRVSIKQLGYVDTTFTIGDTGNVLVNLTPKLFLSETDSSSFNTTNQNLHHWAGITMKQNQSVSNSYILKRFNKDYTTININDLSETFSIYKNTNTLSEIHWTAILDQQESILTDSSYLLIKSNNNYVKHFSENWNGSIKYETDVQKLTLSQLDITNKIELVFAKRQAPIKKTPTLTIHQSESIMVALKELYEDPDAIANDMNFDILNNGNFEFTMIGDSVLIEHKSCNTGHLNFTLKATHDGLEKNEQFNIQVIPLSVSLVNTDIDCFGDGDGTITSTLSSNNSQLYNYAWSNNSTTQNLSSLNGGNYILTITDGNNCTITEQIMVNEPTALQHNATTIAADCNTYTGAADVNPSGGVSPYTYVWQNGVVNNSIENLYAGDYMVTVTDANNCLVTDTINISFTNVPIANSTVQNLVCPLDANGSIILNMTSGTPPYSAIWSNGDSVKNIGNLSGGMYYVTITDAHDCILNDSVFVYEPNEINMNFTPQNDNCGVSSGEIIMGLSGGTAPHIFDWNNGQTTSSIMNIPAGDYQLMVTDANGCQAVGPIINIEATGIPTALFNYTVFDSLVYFSSNSTNANQYTWDFGNGQVLTGSQHQILFPLSGVYPVTLTATNTNCNLSDVISKTIVIQSTNTRDIEPMKELFNVFPNPTTGHFTLQFENAVQDGISVNIYNAIGQIIETQLIVNDKTELDLSNQAAGIYLIQIQTSKGSLTKMLTKQ